jgi:hypothetical protein
MTLRSSQHNYLLFLCASECARGRSRGTAPSPDRHVRYCRTRQSIDGFRAGTTCPERSQRFLSPRQIQLDPAQTAARCVGERESVRRAPSMAPGSSYPLNQDWKTLREEWLNRRMAGAPSVRAAFLQGGTRDPLRGAAISPSLRPDGRADLAGRGAGHAGAAEPAQLVPWPYLYACGRAC